MVGAYIAGLVFGLVFGCFCFVLLFGAPFLPTLRPQIAVALDLLALQPGDTMLELGCGDGRVLIAAAKRGWRAVGYELNPILASIAWVRTRPYRDQIRVVWGNYWQADWPEAQGIFAFILPRYMSKLDKKIMQYPSRPLALSSFAFTVPGRKHTRLHKGVYKYLYE